MKFLKYLTLVLFFSFSIAGLSSYFINKGLRNSKEDMFGKLQEIIVDSKKYNILFLGSSRTLAHINPHIIDSINQKNSYNGGLNGVSIIDMLMLFNLYLKSHPKPDILVLNIDYFTLDTRTPISEIQRYFPYLEHEEIYNTLKKYDSSVEIVKCFPFLSIVYYNDLITYIGLKSFTNLKVSDEYKLEKGYRVNKSTWSSKFDKDIDKKSIITSYITSDGLRLLNNIIDLCKRNSIKLIFTQAPIYSKLKKKIKDFDKTMRVIEKIAIRNDLNFLRYDTSKIGDNSNYFYDPQHMNYKGANIYSMWIAKDIKLRY